MKFNTIVAIVVLLLAFANPGLATEQVFYYITDPAGTPLVMTDDKDNVVWTADYKPFGEEHAVTGAANNSKRFVGKEKDEETGLSYFGARYEDARSGRFIAVDPVRVVDPMTSKTNEKLLLNPQRLNVYAYALNNPYRFVDPDGREPFSAAAIINLLLPSTANAPEYRYTPTIGSQTTSEFAAGVALAETGSFAVGRLLSMSAGRAGLSFAEQTSMVQFTGHGAKQAAERGFSPERIARVLIEGKPVEATGRFGPQTRYILGENTVVMAKEGANANKIITTYSSQTANGVKGHWIEPK